MRGVAATLACFTLLASLLAWSRWLARRPLASMGHAALAIACAVLAAFLWILADGLASFEPLRPGMAVAELRFDDAGTGRYRATLVRLPQGRVQVFGMPGDRWRIEAHTLAWHEAAASLGLRPSYRLQRLESGHAEDAAGRSFDLADDAGPDVWAWVRGTALWSRYAEAGVAASRWEPMTTDAAFIVVATAQGLVVEPAGEEGPTLAPLRR